MFCLVVLRVTKCYDINHSGFLVDITIIKEIIIIISNYYQKNNNTATYLLIVTKTL